MIIPIVFSTDDNYVLPLSVAIQSLKNHKNTDITLDIYVFYDRLVKENQDLILSLSSETCNIKFINVTSYFENQNLKPTGYITIAMYYRIAAPLILSQYEKIIYLDCDIVVRDCISNLYNIDLNDKIIAGGHDIFFYGKNEFINSGILVFDVKKYIEAKIFEKSLKIIEEFSYNDQYTINLACAEQKYIFDYKYNYLSMSLVHNFYIRQQNITKIEDIKIMHYVSKHKPWIYVNFPLANLWWKEAKKLPKEIYKKIKQTYKPNKIKFKDGIFKYIFGNWLYKKYVNIRLKIKNTFFKKQKIEEDPENIYR